MAKQADMERVADYDRVLQRWVSIERDLQAQLQHMRNVLLVSGLKAHLDRTVTGAYCISLSQGSTEIGYLEVEPASEQGAIRFKATDVQRGRVGTGTWLRRADRLGWEEMRSVLLEYVNRIVFGHR